MFPGIQDLRPHWEFFKIGICISLIDAVATIMVGMNESIRSYFLLKQFTACFAVVFQCVVRAKFFEIL